MAATQKKKQQEAPAPQVEARIDRIQPVLQMLEQVPQLDTILLCLDNDEAGHQASRRMREQLEMRYSVERLIPENKDWNDDLTLSGENAQGFSMNEMR